MKKFFIGLGIFFVLAGIVFCAADTKDTSARAQALYDAPVVTMQDLEEWKNQDTQQEVVVTQIPLTGDLVSDPRKFLDGQFYYLKVEKWIYQKEEDEDSSGWEKEDGGSYTVRGDHVAAALDDQTERRIMFAVWNGLTNFTRAEKMETPVIRSGDWERMRS